jgi:hypothetical protein
MKIKKTSLFIPLKIQVFGMPECGIIKLNETLAVGLLIEGIALNQYLGFLKLFLIKRCKFIIDFIRGYKNINKK